MKDEEPGNIAISIKEAQAYNSFQTGPVTGFYPATDNITEGVKKMKIDTDLFPKLPRLPEYKMNASPRGYCLIINNVKFYHIQDDDRSHKLKDREGSDIDAKNLVRDFEEHAFLVDIKENLTDTEIVRVCTEFSMSDHKDFDCFVCCILTHGDEGYLFGCNGYKCPIKEITSCFKAQRCQSLVGKPKLFFFQSCQGSQEQSGYSEDIEMDAPDPPQETIPDEPDFLLGYATVPGFVSYRSKTQGSLYITILCEKLHKFGKEYDMLSVLTLVNEAVSMRNVSQKNGTFKQVPALMHTLRKKVQFC